MPTTLSGKARRFAMLSSLTLALATTALPVLTRAEPVKQRSDGEAPTQLGPGSQAFQQKTDGEAPTPIGPGSQAFKQKTDGEAPTPDRAGQQSLCEATERAIARIGGLTLRR